jgi:hypothetical protein
MPQHLWITVPTLRRCEVCNAMQVDNGAGWSPPVHSICPGDDDEPPTSIGGRRPRPSGPTGGVLEAI